MMLNVCTNIYKFDCSIVYKGLLPKCSLNSIIIESLYVGSANNHFAAVTSVISGIK